MKNLLVAIISEGLFSLVALLVISAIVWFGGEYFGYPIPVRIVVIVAILGTWLILYLVQRVMAVRRAMRIEAMLRAQASSSGAVTQLNPIDTMVHQFRVGVRALRDTRPGRSAVQTMPWFLVMGHPGSGKTAAVRESGLNFPFVGLGHRASASAGPTRALDWWYAERAVFLDTSGAYVADAARHKEWLALLGQLRGTGRTTPVDGVVLVVSIASLLALEEDRITDHAQALRDRIDELADKLGMVFPVYLMFSHCDRLHGFVDFFSHFPLEERGQVWGCTFDWRDAGPQGLQAKVEEEFQRLYQVLDLRRIEALAASSNAASAGTAAEVASDQQRNALLFPIQFALLQRRVGQYISALSRPNPFQESGRLRGFYFTSATQGGVPLDRVMGSIGLGETALQPMQVAEQRPYFLNAPFAQVIPADQGLARTSMRALRRHRVVRTVLAALALGLTTAGGFYLYRGYEETKSVLGGLTAVGQRLRSVEPGNAKSVEVADELFEQLARYESGAEIPWLLQSFLLNDGDISHKARSAYLTRIARPLIAGYARTLALDLSAKLASDQRTLSASEAIEERYRVYLMLCGRIPFQCDVVQRPFVNKSGTKPGEARITEAHLRRTTTSFPPKEWTATADTALVERTNRTLRDALWIPLTGIEIARSGADLFPAVDIATLLPKRNSGALSLDKPLPGFFTQAAWDGLVAGAIEERSASLVRRLTELHIDMEAPAVAKRLRHQYEDDFRRQWRELIGNVRIVMPKSLDAVVVRLGELGNAGSPYRDLVQAWTQQKVLRTGAEAAVAATSVGEGDKAKAEAKKNEWLDQALTAVTNLHVVLSSYISTCPLGSRFANGPELDKAVAGFPAYALAIDAALAAYPEDETRPALAAHFRTMVEGARLALERDLMLEAPMAATGLVVDLDPSVLANRLLDANLADFPARWRELLASLSVPRAQDASAACNRMISQSSPQSPLMRMLRAAWRGQKLVSALGAAQIKDEWIDRCGKALTTLSVAYAATVNSEAGLRITRGEELKRLAEAFTAAESEIAAALNDISDERFRAAAARPFAQLREDAQRHLGVLLSGDADRFWNEKVRGRFTHDFAARFPFVISAEDTDAKIVAAFFAPTSGVLWDAERVLNTAADITIAGAPLIRLSEDYRRALVAGKAVRDAMFSGSGDEPTLTFNGELRQRTGVYQALVAIGKEQLDLHENPEARRAFTCTLAEPIACRVAIQVTDGKWIEAASERRPWALLRWAAGATPSVEGTSRVVLTWKLVEAAAPPATKKETVGYVYGAPSEEANKGATTPAAAPDAKKSWLIQLVVDGGPAVALFSRRVFDDLAFPATIAVRPQEQ